MATPGHRERAAPPRRRGTELVLVLLALAVFALGLAMAGLQIDGRVPRELPLYVGVVAAGALTLHTALRAVAPWADPLVLPLATALNGLGLTVIWGLHRADDPGAAEADRQLVWTAIGAAACLTVLLAVRRPARLQRYPYLTAAAGLVLILLPVLPVIGVEVFGARRWIAVGGYTVQPSEFAGILLIVFLAAYLGAKRDVLALAARQIRVRGVKVFTLPRMRHFGPVVAAWGFALLLLVGTRDLGTSLVLFSVFLAMLYTATARKSWVGIGLAMFFTGASAAYLMFWHVRQRVAIWIDPFAPEVYSAGGGGYQVGQGLFALADGGLFGTGFGRGRAEDVFASDSDLVLVSIGEKLGLLGLAAVLLLLALLSGRGFAIALGARDPFLKLMLTGFAFLMAFQVFVVLGGVTALIPLTGLTTPFLAAGGSSLIANWIGLGLWLRVSDTVRRPAPAAGPGEDPTEAMRLEGPGRRPRGVSPSTRATPRR
ncbi:FtsW/RodA/SpoVE family cell cycle protein [Nocardiopsis trehalosi]|uniref:FtsW/RodA/SpoVE family cell cycle protein n=1 Tax=Nocardiopsis trehalosi TaxID=109329 RepID=UPI00082B9AE0|nr:FtsW/RodA/SpoVE family cell cycle protein [Nocardiopsis trehalosi]